METTTASRLTYRLFTADEFQRMIEKGILPRKGVALREGRVVDDRATLDGSTPWHHFTRDDYYAMVRVGILSEGDRVELLDGEVVMMAPIGPMHGGCLDFLTEHFQALVPQRAYMRVQGPVHLETDYEPEPDLMLLTLRRDRYRRSHPRPVHVRLLIEVADTTLEEDREVKMPAYAQAGIPEVWLVNIPEMCLHVYREPVADAYEQVTILRGDDTATPAAFPDHHLRVVDIFEG